jgi:hypothetical protein
VTKLHLQILEIPNQEDRRLCDACEHGVILRGAQAGEELVYCNEMKRPVPIHVVECNRFKEGGLPALYDMREPEDADDLLADFDLDE